MDLSKLAPQRLPLLLSSLYFHITSLPFPPFLFLHSFTAAPINQPEGLREHCDLPGRVSQLKSLLINLALKSEIWWLQF